MKKLIIGTLFLMFLLFSVVMMVLFVADGNWLGLVIIELPYIVYCFLPEKWQFLEDL